MSTNQKNNEDEVDLGSLFQIIGRGFKSFFNFIRNIFKGTFYIIVKFLLFIKTNFLAITIASIIGFAIGVYVELNTKSVFSSELLVNPNFKSARQLYNNISYYNNLVKQKDTAGLAEVFKLDKTSAGTLKKFEIEPIETENDIIDSYNDFIIKVDTTTIKSYEYEEFKNSFSDYNYKVHKITVFSEKNNIFKDLSDVIISSIVKNNYFKRTKKLTNENLNRTDSLYKKNLIQIDSLRKVYMQVMINEAKKQSNGTNIDLGGERRTTKELELFKTSTDINDILEEIVLKKAEKHNIINVISNFQPIGYKIKGVTENYAFLLAILGAGLVILFLLLKQLNNFLNNYNN